MKMMQSEKQIENAVLQYLAMVPGFEAWKVDTTGIYDAKRGAYRKRSSGTRYKGVSDIIGFYKGKFWAIEIKTPQRRNQLTDEQRSFLDMARRNGQVALVITSVDEMIKALEEYHDEMQKV
jgi:penicillin-binding protein-related factor A (putative recombinase)